LLVSFLLRGEVDAEEEQAVPAVDFWRSSSVGNAVRNCSMSSVFGRRIRSTVVE
jgi:hypothetical protein